MNVTWAELERDPYPLLARLRAEEPVSWMDELEMWLVTRYDDVAAVLRQPELFTSDSAKSKIQETFGRQMLSVDGADHQRYKRACLEPFTSRVGRERWYRAVESLAGGLVDRLVDVGGGDLMRDLAQPLSLQTIALVLGLPPRLLGRLRGWYEDFALALQNFGDDALVRRRGLEAAERFRDESRQLLAAAAEEPLRETLVSRLAHLDKETLAPAEALANLMIVLFGGIETTESMIGNALWSLLSQPDVQARVAADPASVELLIDESLRWEPAVQSCTRHATDDCVLREVAIRAGQTVQCMIGGANRDPEVFADPDRFDLDRANKNKHLSFGLASHFCLGAQLARVETLKAVGALQERLSDLSLDPERVTPPFGAEFRKPPSLLVTLAG